MACDIEVDGMGRLERPMMMWKKVKENDCCEWEAHGSQPQRMDHLQTADQV